MYPHSNSTKHFNSVSEFDKHENSIFSRETNTSGVHITESKEGYHLELKLPGYVKDDFNFFITANNDLVLTTERSKATDATRKVGNIIKHSYCYASAFFRKTFHLPNDVVKNEIFIDYKNHILSIDLLKLNANVNT